MFGSVVLLLSLKVFSHSSVLRMFDVVFMLWAKHSLGELVIPADKAEFDYTEAMLKWTLEAGQALKIDLPDLISRLPAWFVFPTPHGLCPRRSQRRGFSSKSGARFRFPFCSTTFKKFEKQGGKHVGNRSMAWNKAIAFSTLHFF